ncbi:MAG: AI-2E family transporter [Acidobacteriota bacterium]
MGDGREDGSEAVNPPHGEANDKGLPGSSEEASARGLVLSDRQRMTVTSAVTILSATVILLAVGAVLYFIGALVSHFSNVWLPLAAAAVAALVFQPYYEWLRERARMPKTLAVGAVFLSAIVPLLAFAGFFGALVLEQITDLVAKAPSWWESTSIQLAERWPAVQQFLQEDPYGVQIQQALEENSGSLMEALRSLGLRVFDAGAGVLKAVVALLGWLVAPVYFAFFLMAEPREFDDLGEALPFLKPGTRSDVVYLVSEFVNIIVAFFRGQLIIAFLQGILFAIGFSIVGLKYGFVIGLALGFLNIVPYLGNILGLGVAIPLALFQPDGGLMRLLAVMVVFVIVQSIEGYVLTPRIMGERTGLHPMVIIVAIFFWGSALSGITGMILAIPLTAFLVVFWRLAREKYVGELV